MNAEILCVGTEILLGDIVNTNAAYLARELAAMGIGCYYQSVVGDNADRLADSLGLALSRADIVITTGGLGPTYDDLTKETVARHFGLEMELHPRSMERMTAMMSRFARTITPNNEKQAHMPKGAIVFDNDNGTAPGLAVEGKGKIVVMLPGPPREMTAMFEEQVKPYLRGKSEQVLRSHTIHLFGIGESTVEQILHQSMLDHTNPTIAPYAKLGEVQLRITAAAKTEQEAEDLTKPVVEEICGMFPEHVYGVDVGDLQTALIKALLETGKTIAVAESCTGGMIASRLTDVPGSSGAFLCGVASYSNQSKTRLLGVKPETLEQYGAVSAETAAEMAKGVREVSGADIAIATTGIAGPSGGTPEKPVGLVYLGFSSPGGEETVELKLGRGYSGEREIVRNSATLHAMNFVLRKLKELP